MKYEAPKIVDLGRVEELTFGKWCGDDIDFVMRFWPNC